MKLKTNTEQFESLHVALNKTRSTSETVRVPKQALVHILMDHNMMYDDLRNQNRIGLIDA